MATNRRFYMKFLRILVLSAILIFLTSAPAVFAADKDKIGYVDLSGLFDEYYKTKDYDKVLEAKSNDYEKDRNTKIEKIREAQGKLALLKEEEKNKLNDEIEKMKADLLEYDKQKKTDLTKERNEKIREILLEIEKVVSDYAQKNGYTIILNDRVLIYGEKSDDVTEPISKTLNQGKPAESKSDNKSAAKPAADATPK